jgi:hypothetical protein
MNSALIVSIVSSITAMLFMYMDTKILDNPKSKFTYLKNMILVGAISYAIVYFMGNPSLSQIGGSVAELPYQGTTSLVTDIGQEIMTGMPNF